MNEDELAGMLALVNPALENDPLGQQGKAGMIIFADLSRDDIYLTFGQGDKGLYSSDALLVFKRPNEIYKELMTGTRDIEIPDLKTLYRMGMLLEQGNSKGIKEAMKLAEENPGTHSRAMVSLKEQLGPELELAMTQSQEPTQSRGR